MIDCNNCPNLVPTEEQQERLWRAGYKKAMFPHICAKYGQRVLHYPYDHPMIHPCRKCEEDIHTEICNEIFDDYGYDKYGY